MYDAVVAEAPGRLFERIGAAVAAGERAGLVPRLAAAYFDFLSEDQGLQRLLVREVLDQGESTRAPSATCGRCARSSTVLRGGRGDAAPGDQPVRRYRR